MRVQAYRQMLAEYGIEELNSDDKSEREEMLGTYPYSVILEGEFMELDNLNKWIEVHIGPETIKYLFYGKVGYNYVFAEYFFADKPHAEGLAEVIPHIYTLYPHSLTPDKAVRSNGYEELVMYDPQDKSAIVFYQSVSHE